MTLQEIQSAITKLAPSEIAELADWLTEYQAGLWDRQIEEDSKSGKLDKLLLESIQSPTYPVTEETWVDIKREVRERHASRDDKTSLENGRRAACPTNEETTCSFDCAQDDAIEISPRWSK
jgi:hypothetical protein